MSCPVLSTLSPTLMHVGVRGRCPPTLVVAHSSSPHVQLHQGVQPSRGGPWGREDHARQGNQRDLACQVHPRQRRGWDEEAQTPASVLPSGAIQVSRTPGGSEHGALPGSPPGTHRGARQPGEASFSSLPWETNHTALPGDALGPGGTRSTLRGQAAPQGGAHILPTGEVARGCWAAGGL